jgi:hypothetical protein
MTSVTESPHTLPQREYVAAGHDAPPPGRRKKKARGSGV